MTSYLLFRITETADRGILSFSPRTPYIITDACISHAYGFMYLAIIVPVRWVPPTSGSTYSVEARSPFALKGGPSAPAARSHALTYDPYIRACMHTYACSSMIPYMELVYAQHSASRVTGNALPGYVVNARILGVSNAHKVSLVFHPLILRGYDTHGGSAGLRLRTRSERFI